MPLLRTCKAAVQGGKTLEEKRWAGSPPLEAGYGKEYKAAQKVCPDILAWPSFGVLGVQNWGREGEGKGEEASPKDAGECVAAEVSAPIQFCSRLLGVAARCQKNNQ